MENNNNNNYIFVDICPTNMHGFCNQMYVLSKATTYAFENNIPIIFIRRYLKEINTNNYTNIYDIINLNETNKNLQQFNISLYDMNNHTFKIDNVYLNGRKIMIDDNELNEMKFNEDGILKIHIKINDDEYILKEQIENNKLKNKIDFFSMTNLITFNVDSNDHFIFYNTLNSIVFSDHINVLSEIILNSNNVIKENKEFNCLHLRLENDAINHWSKETGIEIEKYKSILIEKYKYMINNFFDKRIPIIILAYDYNKEILDYLKINGYTIILTPKLDKYRDICAIVDLQISSTLCNNILISCYETSYSGILYTRMKCKNNYMIKYLDKGNESICSYIWKKKLI